MIRITVGEELREIKGNASYFILALAGEEPVLNVFHIENSESRKENLILMKG